MKKNFVRLIGYILIFSLLISQILFGFAVSADPLNNPNIAPTA